MAASSNDAAILIGVGANLPHPVHGAPRDTCRAALAVLDRGPVRVTACSGFYESAPVPPSGQPWYVNAVARLETALEPPALLARLHAVEADFGRRRGVVNAARVLDLDLLDCAGRLADGATGGPVLPHPRMHLRAFVLLPLREVAPGWRHPALELGIDDLIAALPPGQPIARLPDPAS